MKINLYATFRQVIGAKSIDLDLSDHATVQDMLAALINAHPQLGALLMNDSGQLLRHIHIFINGRDFAYLPGGMQTSLNSVDKIDIFPPVAGG
jgi:molybdopterin synthase sulfur carrier subunit